jgi:DNA-binding HxlR family transcriptional regulator
MAERTYGQFCGFARAVEVVGERWAFLIIRDLLARPKRFTDLLNGLPGIPTNVLTTRLKELEQAGVVRRRVLPRPAGSIVYELTEHGAELEETVMALGRWGAKTLDTPREGEIITVDSLTMAFRTIFQAHEARGLTVSYELRFGDIVLHVRIDKGKLNVGAGPLPDADLILEAGPGIKALMSGEITPAQALADGTVHIVRGTRKEFVRFAQLFKIDVTPAQQQALA